jgi:hypothetical protein
VLALIGGDGETTVVQTAKQAGHQDRFPLATLRLDGVEEMLGAALWFWKQQQSVT